MSSADFYVGAGAAAEWVISVGAHARPQCLAELDVGRAVLTAKTEQEYSCALHALGEFYERTARGVVYQPRGAWPEASWLHPHLAGCRYVFDRDEEDVGRVWVAEPAQASWRPASGDPATDRWPGPSQNHTLHPDTGHTIPTPCDPAATAEYAYVRVLCDYVRRSMETISGQPGMPCGSDVSNLDLPRHDLLVIAGSLVADAERHAARYDVRTALISARRARDAMREAQRITV